MTPITISSADARCPDCGNGDAIVRVKGNAISSVCTVCRRADVAPMLDEAELLDVSPELAGDLLELEAARCGSVRGVTHMLTTQQVIDDNDAPYLRTLLDERLSVELRMPVPTR